MASGSKTPGVSQRRRRWGRVLKLALGVVLLCVVLFYLVFVLPFWGIPFNQSRHGRVPLTPPWALECWLWEDDVNTAASVTELLEGYARHDFPVRTIMIDSPWSHRYNDFKVDEERYPEPEKFFRDLQDRGYRVVLWMTCMVNSRSKDTRVKDSPEFYEEARSKGYLAGAGYQWRWWKGTGGFIDYSNPDAMKWWQGLQEQVLDWGVDGWKLDGCDTFFSGRIWKIPVPFNRAHSGWMTTRQYMDHYARDEYQNGLNQNPEFVTLIRSIDRPWSHPEGFAPLDAAPVTWVGDNQHTWSYDKRGLEAALSDILQSARLGYCVIGSDVAGYHGRSNPDDIGPATSALLASWVVSTNRPSAATNGFPRTASGPRSQHAAPVPQARDRVAHPGDAITTNDSSPSNFSSQLLAFSFSHSVVPANEFGTAAGNEIAPNLYIRWAQFSTFCGLFLNGGHGERRMWKRTPAELEIIRKFSWLHTELVPYMYSHVVECHNGGPPLMRPLSQGKFHYLFGNDVVVAPIHADKADWQVSLPAGRWRYFFDDLEIVQGPAQVQRDFPLDEYPVFVRSGAIIPLNVSRAYTGFGDTNSAGFITWLIYPDGNTQFALRHPETHPRPEGTTVQVASGPPVRIEFSGRHAPHILRVHSPVKPQRVMLDGGELPEGSAWQFNALSQKLIIKTRDYAQGSYEIVPGG